MYLFWKRNSLGGLAISSEGICDFVNNLLSKPYECAQVSLSAREDCLFLVITLPKGSSSLDMEMLEAKVKSALEKLGFSVKISWAEIEKLPYAGRGDIAAVVRKPLFWALWGAGCSVLIMSGLKILLWSIFWGTVFYFGTTFVQSEKGGRFLKKLKGMAGR